MLKLPLLFCLFLLLQGPLFAQEFTVHPNGLIYGETTMKNLERIVDSLNLKFKSCELGKRYLSLPQGRGHYFHSDSANLGREFLNLLRQNPSAGMLERWNPAVEWEKDLLVYQLKETDNDGKASTVYESIPFNYGYGNSVENPEEVNHYFIFRQGKSYFHGYYFPDGLKQYPFDNDYGRKIQYVDCMVDTSIQNVIYDGSKKFPPPDEKQREILDNFEKIVEKEHVEDKMENPSPEFLNLLKQAVEIALATDYNNENADGIIYYNDDRLERLAYRFYSKKAALELKRKRVVYGMCSQDSSPREHALDVACLAAETGSWELFLRAHLNILNDRFPRMIDASYGQIRRQTYIREIETLGINVPDIILGSCLFVQNAGEFHYYGNIGRIGRAIRESKDLPLIESEILRMIEDPTLDEVNRLRMVYLFRAYCNYMEEKPLQMEKTALLQASVDKLPIYMREKIILKKD